MGNLILVFALGVLLGGILTFLLWIKRILAKEKAPEDDNQKLFRAVTHALENEQNRIAGDMHDELATSLTSMFYDLQIIAMEADRLSPETEKRLEQMRGKINGSIEALRRIIYGLLPDSIERGDLNFAVNELCTKKNGWKGTKINLVSNGESVLLSTQQKLYLYRIIQELINNSIKHSQAWHIEVKIDWREKDLLIEYKDDGRGFSNSTPEAGRQGMANIYARSSSIGATVLSYKKGEFIGMEFQLSLPIARESVIAQQSS